MADTNTVDVNEEDERSQYQDIMRFPIYYDNAVDNDETQGRVVLSDAYSATVTWNQNQIPTMQMTYPRDGIGASLIQREGIIMTDVNRILTHQKFRVKRITKTESQYSIDATHIIGDLAGITLKQNIQLPSVNSSQVFDALMNNATDDIPDIRYDSDISAVSNVNIDMTNGTLSNYIFDADAEGDSPTQSLIGLFGGEITADNYHIMHYKRMGRDTGIVVRYGDKIQTLQQDDSIENTYTAIYPYAKYTPGQAIATSQNTDWTNWATDWNSVGTVQYAAGGDVDIYDSPVAGHTVIGHLSAGTKLKLGTPVQDGSMTPDGKYQINTVNGDSWYPISTESGGGWINARWVNFSKSGDYLVNDVSGHIHTSIKDDEIKGTHYAISGTGVVDWPSGSKKIRVFYSPEQGAGHYPTGVTLKHGAKFNYDQVAYDDNGHPWYRIGTHQWLYGPHVNVKSSQTITSYPSSGRGYIPKDTVVYHIDKNKQMVAKTHNGKLVSTRKKSTPKTKIVYRGKGKNRKKVKEQTYYWGKTTKYHKQVQTKTKKGVYKLNKGQVVVNGTIYYKISDNTYVKKSAIDKNHKSTVLPKNPSEYDKGQKNKKGWIEVYSSPTPGASANWTVGTDVAFAITKSATSGDGTTWYEITYQGKTGWIRSDQTDFSAPEDLEPTSIDDSGDGDDQQSTVIDQADVLVELDGDGLVYPENDMQQHEVQRILNVDLSAYIKHDDQDLSGQQADGTFAATADDKRQLEEVAKQYVIEHNIGHPNVTLTLNYAEFDDIDGDITAINMYDKVTVSFSKIGIDETAEVSATTYDALAHHYTMVTIGDIPKTWQHLLLDAANKNADNVQKSVRNQAARNDHLFGQMANALRGEGSDRAAAEAKIMEELGMVDEKTGKLDISLKTFDQQMRSIMTDVNDISNAINSGGTSELRFVDNSGSSNFLHPTEIRASTPYGYLRFNNNGLGFMGYDGIARAAITADGHIAAEYLDAGLIKSLNIQTGEIHGALKVGDPDYGIGISIGTVRPSQSPFAPNFGGNGIWLDSSRYHSLVSSGRFVTTDGGDTWEYGTNGPIHNGTSLKSMVRSWVADYITVNGKRHQIWKG